MTEPIVHLGEHVPVHPVADEASTLGSMFVRRAEATPERIATYEKREGSWQPTTWQGFFDQAAQVAKGLIDLGVAQGERVAILGPTHAPWGLYDLGAHLAGLVTVGVYPMQAAEQVRYLLEHSESRVIFVADETELETVLAAAEGLDGLRAIVPWTEALATSHGARDTRVLSPRRFRGEALDRASIDARQPSGDDTAILIYTSGTTGPPKGAMITHRNVLSLLRSQPELFPFFEDDLLISFLPMAHATERVLAFYARVNSGVAAAYATSIGAVLGELREVRPTVFGSVPRLFEKAYAKIQSEMARKPALVRALFGWADGVARRRIRCKLAGEPVPAGLAFQFVLADKLVFRKIRAAFGGRVRACITGAAPIALDILEFLWGIEMPIVEGYGMTEATVITHINRLAAPRLGTVGTVIPPMEARIADDGEILLRGPFVFPGYFKNEEATRETVQDGWLHSGDIGTIDGDGYLRITDRKKHLIITAGGKNVAPANIERAIKNQSPLISQVHAHGDRRPFIAALIAPSPLETLAWGREHGLLEGGDVERLSAELMANPSARSPALADAMAEVTADRRFQQLFVAPVQTGNRDLARVERVRRFFLLERDFSQEEGELTPTMKMKRKAIEEKFADRFDRVYDDPDFAIDAEPAA